MIPGQGLLRLLMAWFALSLVAAAVPMVVVPWLAIGLAILVAAVVAGRSASRPALKVERRVATSLPLGEWSEVTWNLVSEESRDLHLEVFDHYPTSAELDGLPATLTVPAGGTIELTYRLRPRRRGDARFGRLEIWRRSTFDLIRRRHRLGEPEQVRVLPNFRRVLVQGLAGLEERVAQSGIHLQRRRGEGLEFQELRDYRDGDSERLIDWKATARRGKLIARQYQDERNQQVVLLLDCGRRMHASEGDLTHFDHVLNAALVLSYVAIRQGDAIGVQAFAGQERWLPPTRGPGTLHRVLDSLHDLQTSNEAPDYVDAAMQLMARQRRRALVLMLTNLRDEFANELLPAIRILRQRHLVLVASTRELALAQLQNQQVTDHRSALAVTAAGLYLSARDAAHLRVRNAGAFILDVEPPELPLALVARYLDIKRAGQL